MPAESVIAELKAIGLTSFVGAMTSAKDSVKNVEDSSKSMGKTAQTSSGKMGMFAGAAGKAKAGAIGIAAAATAFAVKSGVDYNKQIDAARLKFGLFSKSQKETAQIMTDVGEVAKKSTFARPELNAVAAQLGFMGVKAKSLGHDVDGIANAATAVGGSSADLAHVGEIMSRMAMGGKASSVQLSRLAQAGLPVYSVLQKKLHLTSEEIQNIGKKGIDSRKIYEILMNEFTSGKMAKAAQVQAESTAGRMHNVMGTLKRNIGELFQPLWLGFGTKVLPAVQKGLKPAFAWLRGGVSKMVTDIRDGFNFDQTGGTKAFGFMGDAIFKVGQAASKLFELFKSGAGNKILQAAFKDLKPILDFVIADIKILWQVAQALWPVIKLLAEAIGITLYAALLVIGPLFKAATWVIQSLFGPALIAVAHLLGNLANVIMGAVQPAVGWLKGAAGTVVGAWRAVTGFFSSLPGKISSAVSGLAGSLKAKFEAAKSAVLGVLNSIPGAAAKIGKAIIDAIVSGIKSAPGAIASAVASMIPGPVKAIANKVPGLSALIGHQMGGVAGTSHTAVVGEHGPEIMNVPAGTRITPMAPPMLSPSQLMGGGRGQVVVPVYLDRRQIALAMGDYTADQQASR